MPMTKYPEEYDWIPIYKELADKLLQFKDDRTPLLKILSDIFDNWDGFNNPFREKMVDNEIHDTCPFTVFASFNKTLGNEKRKQILEKFKSAFQLKSPVPEHFTGIPLMSPLNVWFYGDINERLPEHIPNLWNLFAISTRYADNPTEENKHQFITLFDTVIKQPHVQWNITMGLFWIRPEYYINLDSQNRKFITKECNLTSNFKKFPSAEKYLTILKEINDYLSKPESPVHTHYELSHYAFEYSPEKETNDTDTNSQPDKFWIYAPGENASEWERFYKEGIMGIGWDDIGDLSQFKSKSEIQKELQKHNKGSQVNNAKALWDFYHEMKIGDIVLVRSGTKKFIGRGKVTSDYYYKEDEAHYHHYRKIEWTDSVEKSADRNVFTIKTLTPISKKLKEAYAVCIDYMNYHDNKRSQENSSVGSPETPYEKGEIYTPYTDLDFLSEVFISENEFHTLKSLLLRKKNIILQGPPGVGKTFSAKRLAYAVIGEKNTERISSIQFHQNYSYEDFIQGYRPSPDGFILKNGPFYEFCKKAEADSENKYFFIIDEINRGNLSKIFGELLMLVEADKRGNEIRMLYSDEPFSVPENIYIIGMMNTADRSLAMIDYALRRRFSFFSLKPNFDSEGFKKLIKDSGNTKFERFVNAVKTVNNDILNDTSLGDGCLIGHSYLCPTDKEVTDEWLHAVLEYDIIPLLKEYWFDDTDKFEDSISRLKEALR